MSKFPLILSTISHMAVHYSEMFHHFVVEAEITPENGSALIHFSYTVHQVRLLFCLHNFQKNLRLIV